IQDAAAANFNSIRVWGGGVYPSEDFFDLCDIYGLVNWQDMMFACAIYDVSNRDFLDNVSEEVRANLKRIRHHASVGLICGNNEMEDGIMSWFPSTNVERMEYLKQYEFVFPAIAEEVCPELFYWPSSPSSGGSYEKPNAPEQGDCHFWEVWHGLKPFSEYEKHYFRYMSEFGFESYPDMKTIESFTEPDDRNPFSRIMDDHQRCPGGNSKIFYYMSQYFKAPADLKGTVYLSQLSQADALTTGIRHWRRNRGRCMGAVYWQLNDNWPVASWASIDYFGRWKALHYEAKRAFENLLVSCEGKGTGVSLWLSNEDHSERRGKLEWTLCDFSGKEILSGSENCVIGPFSSRSFITMDFSEELKNGRESDRFLFVIFAEEGGRTYRASHAFAPYKHMNLVEPGLTVSVADGKKGIEIRVKAARPALFVRLDMAEGDCVLSDNFFHIGAGEERILTPLRGDYTREEWERKLEITSLFHSAY
ncbi:MAG: glycoside hydrolase family 2 protein, partial [Spirochaetales bacterium]|nr:glycoside hydrolase family 2 protein [Spirochaetales bacterium]